MEQDDRREQRGMIIERLRELEDREYGDFQAKLTPGVERERIIGVRVPKLRALAKELLKMEAAKTEGFLDTLPHEYYDENLLHALLISELKDEDAIYRRLEDFLPHVDNWAVCDTMAPKCLAKNPERLLRAIRVWSESDELYTSRFGIEMLMSFFLDERFEAEYLEIPLTSRAEGYYIDMMKAWFYATALAKQWDCAIPYLTEDRLDAWTHNKTIQKARESRRITPEQKEYLKTLKR